MSVTKKSVVSYLIFSITLLIISAIYNHYSHNVTSIFMSYVFIIPLLGALLSLLSKKNTYHNLLGASILTLSLSSLLEGIVAIAGTTSYYVYILLIIGLIMLILSLFKIH